MFQVQFWQVLNVGLLFIPANHVLRKVSLCVFPCLQSEVTCQAQN